MSFKHVVDGQSCTHLGSVFKGLSSGTKIIAAAPTQLVEMASDNTDGSWKLIAYSIMVLSNHQKYINYT